MQTLISSIFPLSAEDFHFIIGNLHHELKATFKKRCGKSPYFLEH